MNELIVDNFAGGGGARGVCGDEVQVICRMLGDSGSPTAVKGA